MKGGTVNVGPHNSSIRISVVTLLKNIIGGGIFSLPVGLWHATPHVGLGILALIGVLMCLTYWMIGYCCDAWGVATFRELWNHALGKNTAWVIDMTLFLNGWFTLVAYLVLIGDFTTASCAGLFGEDHFLATSRYSNQWTITLVLLLPLSLAKDLRKLAFTSVLGLSVLFYVTVLVVWDSWSHRSAAWSPDVVLLEWRMGAFEAIAIYGNAFIGHYNAPKQFGELEDPTAFRWFQFVASTYCIVIAVYAVFAYAGFSRFQGEITGNILRNFDPDFKILIATFGMGFSVAFTYPLQFNAMREAAVNLWMTAMERTTGSPPMLRQMSAMERQETEGRIRRSPSISALLGPSVETDDQKLSKKPGNKVTVLLVLLTAIAGTFCDDVGTVNALAGAMFSCLIAFVFPSCLLFSTARQQLQEMVAKGIVARLEAPLLGKMGKSPRAGSSLGFLRFLLVAAVVAGVSGLSFGIIGTVVVLKRASSAH